MRVQRITKSVSALIVKSISFCIDMPEGKLSILRVENSPERSLFDSLIHIHICDPKNYYRPQSNYRNKMSAPEDQIEFSKKVDEKGRLVIPQEIRQALTIDNREALVKFAAEKVTYLDEDDGGES